MGVVEVGAIGDGQADCIATKSKTGVGACDDTVHDCVDRETTCTDDVGSLVCATAAAGLTPRVDEGATTLHRKDTHLGQTELLE